MVEVDIQFLLGVAVTVFIALIFFGVIVLWDVALAVRSLGDKIDKLDDNLDDDLKDIGYALERITDLPLDGGGTQLHLSGGMISSAPAHNSTPTERQQVQTPHQPDGVSASQPSSPMDSAGVTTDNQSYSYHGVGDYAPSTASSVYDNGMTQSVEYGTDATTNASIGDFSPTEHSPQAGDVSTNEFLESGVSPEESLETEMDDFTDEDSISTESIEFKDAESPDAGQTEKNTSSDTEFSDNINRFAVSNGHSPWYQEPLFIDIPQEEGAEHDEEHSTDMQSVNDENSIADGMTDEADEVEETDKLVDDEDNTTDIEDNDEIIESESDDEDQGGEPVRHESVDNSSTEPTFSESSEELDTEGESGAVKLDEEFIESELEEIAAEQANGSANESADEFEPFDVDEFTETDEEDPISLEEAASKITSEASNLSLSDQNIEISSDIDESDAILTFEFEDEDIDLSGSTGRLLRYQLRNFVNRDSTWDGTVEFDDNQINLQLHEPDGATILRWGEAVTGIIDRTLYLSDNGDS